MNTSPSALPRWYWVVAVLATLWMCIGVMALVMDFLMDETALAALTEAQQELYQRRPAWIFGVYAVATLSGLAGGVGLLLRKAWAVGALTVSLAAVTIQFGYTMLVMDAIGLLGAGTAIPFPLTIFVIGAATLWFARIAHARGWLA